MGKNLLLEEPDRRLLPLAFKISSAGGKHSEVEALFDHHDFGCGGTANKVQVSAIAQMPTRPPISVIQD